MNCRAPSSHACDRTEVFRSINLTFLGFNAQRSIAQVIEFIKGHVAFNGEASPKGTWSSEDDHLAQYMEVLGPMPPQLLERGTKTRSYFDEQGNLLRIPNWKPHPLAQASAVHS
ncbi:hypothetical protein EJ03DRAFT_383313 [Teratosphaeria nubilosa]|uniref:Uncharacterized protein n=1 Tax=Teratosphaeria nubilosa TaxID=161662 RepID=A0A6G1L6B5_9PEZI|nr:hypothetical protein EJ03DRAFT_383313 [Teratosphaeria nubilosa]